MNTLFEVRGRLRPSLEESVCYLSFVLFDTFSVLVTDFEVAVDFAVEPEGLNETLTLYEPFFEIFGNFTDTFPLAEEETVFLTVLPFTFTVTVPVGFDVAADDTVTLIVACLPLATNDGTDTFTDEATFATETVFEVFDTVL